MFVGCYADKSTNRALPYYQGSGLKTEECADKCAEKGFKYFGLQSNQQCRCGGDSYDKYGKTHGCACDASNIRALKNCIYENHDRCKLDSDCDMDACGHQRAGNDAPLVCCPSGKNVRYAGYDYCYRSSKWNPLLFG